LDIGSVWTRSLDQVVCSHCWNSIYDLDWDFCWARKNGWT
jgi:hypothetical protein